MRTKERTMTGNLVWNFSLTLVVIVSFALSAKPVSTDPAVLVQQMTQVTAKLGEGHPLSEVDRYLPGIESKLGTALTRPA